MNPKFDKIIQKLIFFKKEIVETDLKLRQYVSDRNKYRHPYHEDLIKEIRRYENQIYNTRNTEVQIRLDSLLYSLTVYERVWKKLFEQSELNYIKKRPMQILPKDDDANSDIATSSDSKFNPIIEKVYEASKKQWKKHAESEIESKESMKTRILNDYKAAQKKAKKGQKVAFKYSKTDHKMQVYIKDV